MTEPSFPRELTPQMGPSSASVPIPGGHRADRSGYEQFSPSPLANPGLWTGAARLPTGDSPLLPLEPLLSFSMDDDDIFQVDKADLIQGPTLAELNANEDTLLGDLNFDDLLLPDEPMQPGPALFAASSSFPQPAPPAQRLWPAPEPTVAPPELLLLRRTTEHERGRPSRLSSSAPSQCAGLEQLWARREPRPHLLSTGSLGPGEHAGGSTSSLSTAGALSPVPALGGPTAEPLSHDEGYEDSDDESEHYEDCSSEPDSPGGSESEEPERSRREKYFWQYNVQAKGPKGQRLVARSRLENPHVLNQATDPVFSPHCALQGIKHSGKARKGDGNDLTPNPRKLHAIGKELDKLSRIINDMTPVSELPFPVRPKTRKEKNKLASRACRLKKKAQHEANKIKLHGLEQEHKRLIHGIAQAKQILAAKLAETNREAQDELTRQMDKICKSATKIKIASHSTEFVNKVLDKVKTGVPDGGIDDI